MKARANCSLCSQAADQQAVAEELKDGATEEVVVEEEPEEEDVELSLEEYQAQLVRVVATVTLLATRLLASTV